MISLKRPPRWWVAVLILVGVTAIAPGAEALCRHCHDPTWADRLSDERNKSPTPAPVPAPQRSAQELKALALSKISISDWSWQTPGDIVMIADFTFRNGNPFYVKDLKVLCVHTAPSGTVIDWNTRTIYEIVPAYGSKSVRQFNMGLIHSQAQSSSCKIIDFEMAGHFGQLFEPDLPYADPCARITDPRIHQQCEGK